MECTPVVVCVCVHTEAHACLRIKSICSMLFMVIRSRDLKAEKDLSEQTQDYVGFYSAVELVASVHGL